MTQGGTCLIGLLFIGLVVTSALALQNRPAPACPTWGDVR
jgi:hypothetical protein